jgi:hypothetical protein
MTARFSDALSDGLGGVIYVTVAQQQMFLEVPMASVDGVLDFGTQAITYPSPPRRHTVRARAVADGALVVADPTPYALALLRPDASVATLVSPTAPQVVWEFALDRANRDAIVWLEGDDTGSGYANTTLWTSPYASDPSGVQKRKVAKLTDPPNEGSNVMVANKGVALHITAGQTAVLTRLSDGMGWLVNAEPADAFADVLWVDDNDVWLVTSDASELPHYVENGIVRISRASLGAPTVPSGL